MSYAVKEIYYTLQGEGARTGRAAVFCRFSGCNLWSGRELDRGMATCQFCDTDFVGTDGVNGGKYASADKLAGQIAQLWPRTDGNEATTPYVVFTGGEPLLQLDEVLLQALKSKGFETAVESNGTISAPDGIDWLTISPKAGSTLVQKQGSELKLVVPQELDPADFLQLSFEYFYLSPMTTASARLNEINLQSALSYCLANPRWRLTQQAHKLWGVD